MSIQPDHEFEILEYDQTVPPRPEEVSLTGRARGGGGCACTG